MGSAPGTVPVRGLAGSGARFVPEVRRPERAARGCARGHSTTCFCGPCPDSTSRALGTAYTCPQAASGRVTRWRGGGFYGRMNLVSPDPHHTLHRRGWTRRSHYRGASGGPHHRRRSYRPEWSFASSGQIRSLLLASLLASALIFTTSPPSAAAATDAQNWVSPVPAMEIINAFDPPDKPWLKGHRGIDVLAVKGERAAGADEGHHPLAGTVAGTATVSVLTASGHVLSFQPAATTLKKGEEFSAGERSSRSAPVTTATGRVCTSGRGRTRRRSAISIRAGSSGRSSPCCCRCRGNRMRRPRPAVAVRRRRGPGPGADTATAGFPPRRCVR